ncbi:hypothetical protein [Mycolicibacterium smegmatis]|uniref:Uncharacterized protein n=1 Tax=Mycolicibacterium smegmatis (strain MKD8) TaxID=1214915 RepID=A0A2U9Q0L1_MYCSE|nr:hypothetical protein [Mycolicibacterium smegmatis]AWT57474.1 hypothetical protein D806_065410 [Mycolicibacterium smegmatis MKD8]
MTEWTRIQRFLTTDPRDVGCDEAMEVLHIYAELPVGLRAQRYPGVAAHLCACGPCAEDFDGLLAAIAAEDAGVEGADR